MVFQHPARLEVCRAGERGLVNSFGAHHGE